MVRAISKQRHRSVSGDVGFRLGRDCGGGKAVRGFTLVELLVVLAVITLLVSVLLPGLAALRTAGRTTACLSTVGSVNQLTTSFASDRKGQGPMAGRLTDVTRSEFTSGKLPADLLYYDEAGSGSVRRPMPFFAAIAEHAGAGFDTSSIGAMRSALGASEYAESAANFASLAKVARCADDSEFTAGNVTHLGITLGPADSTWTVSSGLGEMSSYMLNEWVLGQEGDVGLRGKLDQVNAPSEVFLAADGTPRCLELPRGQNYMLVWNDASQPGFSLSDYNEQNLSYIPESTTEVCYQFGYRVDAATGRVRGGSRHHKSMNVVYVDGHAATVGLTAGQLRKVRISDPVFSVSRKSREKWNGEEAGCVDLPAD